MIRWIVVFLGAWGICLSGMYATWIVALIMNCALSPGCLGQISIETLLSSVNMKSVMAKGTLLAIASIVIAWINTRRW